MPDPAKLLATEELAKEGFIISFIVMQIQFHVRNWKMQEHRSYAFGSPIGSNRGLDSRISESLLSRLRCQ